MIDYYQASESTHTESGKMVHLSRFERETSAFGGQRSIQLSYRCLFQRRYSCGN